VTRGSQTIGKTRSEIPHCHTNFCNLKRGTDILQDVCESVLSFKHLGPLASGRSGNVRPNRWPSAIYRISGPRPQKRFTEFPAKNLRPSGTSP